MSQPLNKLNEFLPAIFRQSGVQSVITAWTMPADDLFLEAEESIGRAADGTNLPSPESGSDADRLGCFLISQDLALTVDMDLATPWMIQCLLAGLMRADPGQKGAHQRFSRTLLDPEVGLAVWSRNQARFDTAKMLWAEIRSGGNLSDLESLTSARLYGNKQKLVPFILGIAAATLATKTKLIDLMSGTGVVTRKLLERYDVASNDANSYAAVLTGVQAKNVSQADVSDLLAAVREPFDINSQELRSAASDSVIAEANFLHNRLGEEAIDPYRAFCSQPIDLSKLSSANKYHLALSRYANAYFGVAQSIEIDSLRCAIDTYNCSASIRETALAALLLAATTCASGPHFAQPPTLNTLAQFRTVAERRARSVLWEFELALGRLAARRQIGNRSIFVSQGDWRSALQRFSQLRERPAAVYLDPPYSKLQYSRFYHVLNVLIAYDYPEVIGVGRYPPLSQRFSSKFEYQPASAKREFAEIVRACSAAQLDLVISYGEFGFVPISELIDLMRAEYQDVTVFATRVRHNSQGKSISASFRNVFEHVLVGRAVAG